MTDDVCSWTLQGYSAMDQGDFSSYLPLEMEMGGFFIPAGDGGGNGVHGLDMLHNPNWESSQKVRDQGGGVFGFVVLGMDNVQFELVGVFLELFSGSDASGGEPTHGFLLDVGVPKGSFEICFEGNESPEGLVGKTLLVMDFGPHGSRPLFHIGQGIGDFPVIIMVEGLIDKEVEVDRVQPSLGCFCFSIVFIRAPDVNLCDP